MRYFSHFSKQSGGDVFVGINRPIAESFFSHHLGGFFLFRIDSYKGASIRYGLSHSL